MALIHLDTNNKARVACGRRKGGVMGFGNASHWVSLEEAKIIECKACKEIAARRLSRAAEAPELPKMSLKEAFRVLGISGLKLAAES